jgi:hypothetical protein
MTAKATFPRTEKPSFNDLLQKLSDTATSQSLDVYQLSNVISSSKDLPEQDFSFIEERNCEVEGRQPQLGSRQLESVLLAKNLCQNYDQLSMLRVIPADISGDIPESSPIYSLKSLEVGWDGHWADPLSHNVLRRAHRLWSQIQLITVEGSILPTVRPAANGSVAFTWSHDYPAKELEIWLYDQPDYYAEWMISSENGEEDNTADSQIELLNRIRYYQEL